MFAALVTFPIGQAQGSDLPESQYLHTGLVWRKLVMYWPIFYPTSYFDCLWHYGESWVLVGIPIGSVIGSKTLLFQ